MKFTAEEFEQYCTDTDVVSSGLCHRCRQWFESGDRVVYALASKYHRRWDVPFEVRYHARCVPPNQLAGSRPAPPLPETGPSATSTGDGERDQDVTR